MKSRKTVLWIRLGSGLAVPFLVAGLLAPFASSKPDGLERVAADLGFSEKAAPDMWTTPLSGYSVAGVDQPILAVGLAGVLGTALTSLCAIGIGRWRTRAKETVPTRNGRE